MNLRDQLKEILPDILPRNPAQSIKGTELIEMVKDKLKQDYSDATLRYHFSIMSCDPSSPIAKVEHGQGYYLRSSTIHSLNSARNFFGEGSDALAGGAGLTGASVDVALSRANKFRAMVQRYLEAAGQFPFTFEQSFSNDAQANRWRVPDLAVVDWLTDDPRSESRQLEREKMDVFRRVGQSPMRIASTKLKLELNHGNLRESLFQCLSASEWANTGELIVAASIDDPAMIEEIRTFASKFGVGVISFGLDAETLDDLPEAAVIDNLQLREFEALQGLLEVRRYAAPTQKDFCDWSHVSQAAHQNADFATFEKWVSRSLIDERSISAREFIEQERSASEGSAKRSVQREYVA